MIPNTRQGLLQEAGRYAHDPVGYVYATFRWGEGELEGFDGPDTWQREYLEQLGEFVRERGFDPAAPAAVPPIRMATASGHGIGKSALTAWITCWILDTRPGAKGIITANTGNQLRTKTFAELAKWRKRSIFAEFWEVSSGDMYVRSIFNPENHRVDAITWKKEQSEAFAGLHAASSTPFYIFDEASAVDDVIWEVAEGGLTDGEPMFLVFGNPTRNKGRFFECFHRDRHRWITRQIDSREAKLTNKPLIREWIDDHGEDSDFVRIRVRGVFPRAGAKQYIGNDLVAAAIAREIPDILLDEPIIIGVDVARDEQGDESTVYVRRGRDARNREPILVRGLNTHQLAHRVADYANILGRTANPVAAIFVDVTGIGAGVVDQLQVMGYPVTGINFGGKADQPDRFKDKAAEMWGRLKAWLEDGGCLPDDPVLADQLTHREYDHTLTSQIFLQPKDKMREEGIGSPDRADGLALTFAQFVAPVRPDQLALDNMVQADYDPLEND